MEYGLFTNIRRFLFRPGDLSSAAWLWGVLLRWVGLIAAIIILTSLTGCWHRYTVLPTPNADKLTQVPDPVPALDRTKTWLADVSKEAPRRAVEVYKLLPIDKSRTQAEWIDAMGRQAAAYEKTQSEALAHVRELTALATATVGETQALKKALLESYQREQNAAQSALLARAGWAGTGIGLGIVVMLLGVWPTKNLYVLISGGLLVVAAFITVLVFLALAWVAAHLLWVLGGTAAIIGVGVGLTVWAARKGWFHYSTLNATAASLKLLLQAASDSPDPAMLQSVRHTIAAFVADPDGAKSYAATPAPNQG